MEEVGLEIKNYLKEIGMSQVKLSNLTGISEQKVSLALSGKRDLSIKEYWCICGVLRVDVDKFISPETPALIKN